ncbi:MAG TPA: hypothetical protein VHI13_10305 [Candidatus Kapabacteria bacterium]|nr:hypothetical protein [Candidatus Kapabacteria bacterium]
MACIITREQLLGEIINECNICLHLHSKISPDAQDFRPTPGQRSTLELLRYLSVCGIGSAQGAAMGDYAASAHIWQRNAEMTFEGFPAAMNQQIAELQELINGFTDDDFATRTAKFVTGETLPLGFLLVRSTLRWLTAYRMQLFLYAKASGSPELNTVNNWVGIDMPAEQPTEAAEAE